MNDFYKLFFEKNESKYRHFNIVFYDGEKANNEDFFKKIEEVCKEYPFMVTVRDEVTCDSIFRNHGIIVERHVVESGVPCVAISYYMSFKAIYRSGKLDGTGEPYRYKFYIFPDGTILKVFYKGNDYKGMVIAKVKEVFEMMYYVNDARINNAIFNIPAIRDSFIFKDLWRDYKVSIEKDLKFPPIKWSDCIGKQNLNDLFKSVYKTGHDINCSKLGTLKGYCLFRTRYAFNERSKEILFNAITKGEIEGIPCDYYGNLHTKNHRLLDAKMIFFSYLLKHVKLNDEMKKRCEKHSEHLRIELADYINSCSDKYDLKCVSLKTIEEKTFENIVVSAEADTPLIKIPKKSIFNLLEKSLPSEYERIKTKRRICKEGAYMHNCVASYAKYINKDKCAIFHLKYDGVEYTVEFTHLKKHGYTVKQIQPRCGTFAEEDVWIKVNADLIKANELLRKAG